MSVQVPNIPLQHILGDTWRRRVTFRRRAAPTDPWEPMDLTDCEVEFSVGTAFGKTSGAFQYQTTDEEPRLTLESFEHEAQTWWRVVFDIEPAETRRWSKIRVYEVTITWPDNDDPALRTRETYMRGAFTVHLEVAP